ncbi:MAG: DUF3578 domain-containing protein [Candidatus Cloacimonetes bacterium]|jgi:hypothetical protein|nr:DUF3578 domain-containing protein [Candidatus Cloacimonadota bacterium]MBT4333498.1 DUF3578 domain-containing protein [Candidatus Cloacimonadota bacterium]MBT4576049.1 DUF3578 domain-containing protein [Candidatus Cloacimonadota bacterium]
MNNPFNITDEQLHVLMRNYLIWYENYTREEDYIDYLHRIETYINDFLINKDFLINATEDDFFAKVFAYPRMLEGPVQMRLGEARMRNNLNLIKRNLKYIVDSEDDPIEKCHKVLNGSYKIDVFAKSFWSPILGAKYPATLPYWNNKTERFLRKLGINITTKKKSFKEKYRSLSGAFKYLNTLNTEMDFHHINHLTHYGTAVEEGIKLIDNFFTNFYPTLIKFINQSQTTDLHTSDYTKIFYDTNVKVSFGAGNSAKIPWIAFLLEDQKVSDGIYPVYLYYKEHGILILAYGISETNKPSDKWGNSTTGKTITQYFQENNLMPPQRYGTSYLFKAYNISELDENYKQNIDSDLIAIINEYKQNFVRNGKPNSIDSINKEEVYEFDTSITDKFYQDVSNIGFHFDKSLIYRFLASLSSKPFVILTGLSGSGKTKLAQAFVTWICESKENINKEEFSFSLPVNKSAIEHRGWTLPNEARTKYIKWIDKDIQIRIDNQIIDAQLYNPLQLFYEKKYNLNTNYEIGDKVNVSFINPIGSNILSQYLLIPVGADWTNREPLLGYPNALETGKYVTPENGVLELILNAKGNPTKPYFLILDEMNLSHVERYFADFLSAMESGEEIPLHQSLSDWKDDIPDKVKLPKNLFVIGTVNIDETTYMFSPKVLDRANVIEFRVTDSELENFLENPAKPDLDLINGKGVGMASDFVKLAKEKPDNFKESETLNKTLLEFFDELKKMGAEFGYRTASEIYSFCSKLNTLTKGEKATFAIEDMIDAAVLQKLLPKLHGSRKKMEPVLNSLAILCLNDEHKEELLKLKKGKNPNIGADLNKIIFDENMDIDNDKIRFKLSMEKILRMKKRVIQDGFTSFAEA